MVIWKYEFEIADEFTLEFPEESEVLHVNMQHNKPCMWVLHHDINAPKQKRTFHIVGTGHHFDEEKGYMMYIGTFQMMGGMLIWHLWERGSILEVDPRKE
jgi:hypothetical protein